MLENTQSQPLTPGKRQANGSDKPVQ